MSFCPDVTSVVRRQYLESARGHYLSALAGINVGKQERANICDSAGPLSVLEDNALEHAAEGENEYTLEKSKSFSGMDTSLHPPNMVLKDCDSRLQVKITQFNEHLLKNTSDQIAEMMGIIGDSGHEMEPDTVIPELIGVKGYPVKGSVEGVSLQKMVKSLKDELENLKKEHAELKDKGEGAGFDTRKLHLKLHKSKPKHEGSPLNKLVPSHASELIPEDKLEGDDCKVEGKGLKRESGTPKFSEEMVKKIRVDPSFDKAKDTMLSNSDQNKCVPRKIYDTCVSTSESSVRVRVSEDELESSSQKAGKSDKPEKNEFTAIKGQVESAKHCHSSEFSIRDYVFAARNKDISTNWPFSQKNLQLCLKHGVKNVLPPFESVESMSKNSLKRCLTNTSLHSEESKLEEKDLGQKRHVKPNTSMNHQWSQELAEGYRDSDLFPSMEVKEPAFKSPAMALSHSEVESVSTNNLLLSEVSDEQVASVSASASASALALVPAGKKMMKSSASQPSNKKSKVVVKMNIASSRGVTDDITSASTALSEAMASKICPVCQVFSSSSNTTLNAHIDQCLSSQSPPKWMNSSKVVKPRIKPRKMRSMVDILATALSCTLEDLDRRNGTNWATNSEIVSQENDFVTHEKSCVSARHVNNGDDGAVYIDSSGRKIRILSKFNDISSSSLLHKVKEDVRSKKHSKLGKTSKFFSSKRKRRFGKHLKFLKVSQKRKMLSYRKVKGRLNEARGSAKVTSTSGEMLVSEQEQAPSVHASGKKNASLSGTLKLWISSKRSLRSKKDDPRKQPSNNEMIAKKPSETPEKSLRILRSGVRTCMLYQNGSALNNESLSAVKCDHKESVSKSVDSAASPASSIEREDAFQADAGENGDSSFFNSRGLSDGSHLSPCEGIGANNAEIDMPHSVMFKQKSSALEKTLECGKNMMGNTQSAEITPHFGNKKIYKIKNSLGHALRLMRKRGFVCNQDGSNDKKKSRGQYDEIQENHGCERSPAFAEAVLDSKRSIDDESHDVIDVQDPLLESVHYFSPLPSPCQPCSNEDDDMFSDFDACQSLFPEVDPIPIPGPPGSDLPSFSDMGSEDLHRTSSLNSRLAESSGDGDEEVNGNQSDSPFSATSTVSNLGIREDPILLPSIISGPTNVPTIGTSEMMVVSQAENSEDKVNAHGKSHLVSEKGSSFKEGTMVPWNFEESRVVGKRRESIVAMPAGKHVGSTLIGRENCLDGRNMVLPSSSLPMEVCTRAVGCDSPNSGPILRLMGKDLMVVNRAKVDPSVDQLGNRDVDHVSDFYNGFPRSWQSQNNCDK